MMARFDLFSQDRDGSAPRESLAPHFRSLLTWYLPSDARVLAFAVDEEDLHLAANWRLHGDRIRRGKRSRTLRLVIFRDALEDYLESGREAQLRADIRFSEWLRLRWKTLDPNHDAPPGEQPPEVIWYVDSTTLNGFHSATAEKR